MFPLPFIGRLNPAEYIALVGSFILVGLEHFIRILTLALPNSLLSLLYDVSRRVFNTLMSPAQRRAENKRKSICDAVGEAADFVDLCAVAGYMAEEHVVQTTDGFLLGLHRLAYKRGEEESRVNSGPNSLRKPVVYLHHGLLMNSEVWVCVSDARRCLAFVLVEKGYDVWFGNNRGNKYSKKSVRYSPNSAEFWNFSMDEFALHDIPDTIGYILDTTQQRSLSYIGFSQGSAQAFASLSVHPKLNEQVTVFIALAPAMSPAGLHNGITDALIKASPSVLFLMFGRRSILGAATMWQSILYPPIYVRLVDMGLVFLFNWRSKNMSMSQKLAAYPHLYSYTSTKSVVHWFQIIRNKSFQMFDDDISSLLTGGSRFTKVAKYPTRNIRTPVVLLYGGSDSLVDIRVMLKELPKRTVATEIPHYEHLDFLWARDVEVQVFQHVFDALESFTNAEHSKEEFDSFRRTRQRSMVLLNNFRASDGNGTDSDISSVSGPRGPHRAVESNSSDSPTTSTPATPLTMTFAGPNFHGRPISTIKANKVSTPEKKLWYSSNDASPGTPAQAQATPPKSQGTSSPNAVNGTTPKSAKRRGSGASNMSFDSSKDGKGKFSSGIRIGSARPVGGVVPGAGVGSVATGHDDGCNRTKRG